jgi:nuclear control of ATPase protein 2
LDIQLDKVQLAGPAPSSPIAVSSEAHRDGYSWGPPSSRQAQLRAIVRALSTSTSSRPLLQSRNLTSLLGQVKSLQTQGPQGSELIQANEDDLELEWLVVAKATLQTYGLILSTLLEQILPLSDDIWYWDEVLGSFAYTGLYTLQTSPSRTWTQVKEIYQDIKAQFDSGSSSITANARPSFSDRWRDFYDLVHKSVREHSIAHARSRILSPFALCRTEARQKQTGLKRLREMNASGLGVLMDEGLSFGLDIGDEASASAKDLDSTNNEEWRSMVPKSIALIENVLRNVTTLGSGTAEFEELVFTAVEDDPYAEQRDTRLARPAVLVDRLQRILKEHLPVQLKSSNQLSKEYGRPSKMTRYWLPASALLLSSSTLLRLLANRRAEIITWVQEFGSTVVDFWVNWIIEPVKKLIGTIRHDENSEVAIMSKRSLEADRDSLERMVVDFAIDNPVNGSKATLSQSDIADLRMKVKEGDLTSVLKTYEKDLKKPFMGSVRGDLIRAVLIQVQKTKVDVEVAIGGIDALLKSQELVFG